MSFSNCINQAVQEFKNLNKRPVRLIGHLDSDGLCSTSILIQVLQREGFKFVVSVVKQVTDDLLELVSKEDYNTVFFVDLGSGSLDSINKILKNKQVFILDHHIPSEKNTHSIHINPLLFGIDGNKEISGAGVVYLFAKELDKKNIDLAHLALIGAVGDMQENKGFKGINNDIILNDAISSGVLEVRKGLTLFGSQTRPLHKILEYSTDPYIPNVTGSEIGSIKFLEDLGIPIKEGKKFKKLVNLNEDDMKKLITGIILRRLGSEDKPEDILGPIYLLKNEDNESPTKDLKEYSTLLNSCGRLGKYSLGIGACLSLKKCREDAIELLKSYKLEIIKSLDWFYKNKKSKFVIENPNYIIVNAGDNVKDTFIGTITSIISRSNIYKEGVLLISMAYTIDGDIKVSLRCTGYKKSSTDLKELISKIIKKIGSGIAGGHYGAAGALIPQNDESLFIKTCREILDNEVIQESVE